MNIHFNLELSSRTGSKSEKSILIHLTQYRQHRRISTGIKIEEKHWDFKKQRVNKSNPLAFEYSSILQTKLNEVKHVYNIFLEEET